MTSFQAKIVAAVLLGVFFLIPLRCVLGADDVQVCARGGMVDLVLVAVHFWTLANAVWLGMEASKWSGRRWLGWIAGLAVLVALNSTLVWLEFPYPSSGIEFDEENSYRR